MHLRMPFVEKGLAGLFVSIRPTPVRTSRIIKTSKNEVPAFPGIALTVALRKK
jgi:hypothetical protein